MKGRKPLPSAIHELNGNPSRLDLAARGDAEPKPEAGKPKRPAFLGKDAKAAWRDLCGHLEYMGILATSDGQALAVVAQAWGRMVEAERAIAKDGIFVDYRGLKIAHPGLKVVKDSQSVLMRMLPEFGLTPSGRARVAIKRIEGGDGGIMDFIREGVE